MANIRAFIRATAGAKVAKIRLRLTDGRNLNYYGVTPLEVNVDLWNPKTEELKSRILLPSGLDREVFNRGVRDLKDKVLLHYSSHDNPSALSRDWITQYLSKKPAPVVPLVMEEADPFISLYKTYTSDAKVSEARRRHIKVVGEMLQRYSCVKKVTLDINTLDEDVIRSFEEFLRYEHTLQDKHPYIYTSDIRAIKPRGQNTLNTKIKILVAFIHWAQEKQLAKQSTFRKYKFSKDIYGDPIPLLPEEVEVLYALKGLTKEMDVVRDLFCLQCYLGCRIGDFVKLRKDNVHGDLLIYVAEKTVQDNPVTIYVPLLKKAIAIINKYGYPQGKLMPFINISGEDGMNKKIKELCEHAKLTRPVIVINTITHVAEAKKLYEVVSTHTARKTFINSNYMETQDQALISKMTGHAENSKAFARYRNIEMDMLRKQMAKAFEGKKE
jgi:integrase